MPPHPEDVGRGGKEGPRRNTQPCGCEASPHNIATFARVNFLEDVGLLVGSFARMHMYIF